NAAHELGPIARRRFDAHRRVMNDQVRDRRVVQASMSGNLPVGTFPLGSRHYRRLRISRVILFTHLLLLMFCVGVGYNKRTNTTSRSKDLWTNTKDSKSATKPRPSA